MDPQIKIKRIKIKGYRSCSSTTLDLNNELTTLIGINGAGKSNILNGILLLKKTLDIRNNRKISRSDTSKCFIYMEMTIDEKPLNLKGAIFFENDSKKGERVVDSEIEIDFGIYMAERSNWVDLAYERDLTIARRFNSSQQFRFKNTDFWKKINKKDLGIYFSLTEKIYYFVNSIKYYGATQFSNPSKCPISIEMVGDALERSYYFSETTHERFILDLYDLKEKKSVDYKKFINIVSKDGLSLVENLDFEKLDIPANEYTVYSGGKVKTIERKRKLIVPVFQINGRKLSANQLSEGTFKTLALIFYIITSKSKLLIIEEPEVCIHHGLLNSVLEIIKSQSRKKQILMSTHSDYVLDNLSPENIVLIKYVPKIGTIAKTLNKLLSKNNFKALKNYLKDTGGLGDYWKETSFDN